MATVQADPVGRVEALLEQIEGLPDAAVREKSLETVQALLDLYGEALSRLVAYVADRDDGSLAEAVAADDLVSHVLLLHGLHPVPVEERVREALGDVAPYLLSHGGGVELVEVRDGVAHLRLEGSCSGCPSSRVTLKLAVEEAVMKAAPDLLGIEAEGVTPEPAGNGLLQIEIAAPAAANGNGNGSATEGAWAVAGPISELTVSGPQLREVRGESVLFLRVGGEDYAYRPACPACAATLGGADLEAAELVCPGCAARFDVRRAGLEVGAGGRQLQPVPLLVDTAGSARVALGAGG